MIVVFNGEDVDIDEGTSVAEILIQENFGLEYVLVEVDGTIIEQNEYYDTLIEEEETEIECVYLVGGC